MSSSGSWRPGSWGSGEWRGSDSAWWSEDSAQGAADDDRKAPGGGADGNDEPKGGAEKAAGELSSSVGPEARIVGVMFEGFTFDDQLVDRILDVISRRLRCVKEELPGVGLPDTVPPPYEDILNVDNVLQTHGSVSARFRDGRSLEALILELDEGRIDPLSSPFLKFDVVLWPAKGYFALQNRRLLCVKQHQENMRRRGITNEIRVRATVLPLTQGFVELMEADPRTPIFCGPTIPGQVGKRWK